MTSKQPQERILSSVEEAIEEIRGRPDTDRGRRRGPRERGRLHRRRRKDHARNRQFHGGPRARGLICAPLPESRCEELNLPMMVTHNTSLHETPLTVSVDLTTQGCTTGVSVADRAKTIRALVDPATKPEELGRPGHIFPLRARERGVLRRPGHTEAVVDLTRMHPAGTDARRGAGRNHERGRHDGAPAPIA